MRSHLFIVLIASTVFSSVNLLSSTVSWANSCKKFLSSNESAAPVQLEFDLMSIIEGAKKEQEALAKQSLEKDTKALEEKARRSNPPIAKNIESMELIPQIEKIIDIAIEAKLISKPEAWHLRHDLAELKESRNAKEDHPTFKDILGQWSVFISEIEGKIQDFKNLPAQEQKAWKSKMELPVYFATAHFIVFLETNNKKSFDYTRMTNLLQVVRGKEFEGDIKLYLYAFEKQVRKYFSTKEFRRCKA